MAERKTVLITGATGGIARATLPLLTALDRYDLRSGHRRDDPDEVAHLPHPVRCVLHDPATLYEACKGVDTIVHLAADAWTPPTFEATIPNNIIGPHHLCEAALVAGCRRIVFASTNHVVFNWFSLDHLPAPEDVAPRPDNLYGVTKAFGEVLGRFYVERRGLPSFISLRIGWHLPDDSPQLRQNWQALHMWLSTRDCAQLIQRCIDCDLAGYHCFNAISGNQRALLVTDRAQAVLGYAPQDDAERFVPAFEGHIPDWLVPRGGAGEGHTA